VGEVWTSSKHRIHGRAQGALTGLGVDLRWSDVDGASHADKFGSSRSQPAGRDDLTSVVVADECADVAFGARDRCGGRVVGVGMLTGGSAGCGGGCGCGSSGCGGGRCEGCIGGVELAALLLDALLCLMVARSRRGVAPPLVEYDVARLYGLATFVVDGIVCFALACGAEKSAGWRVNAPGFRRGVVQGVGLEVLLYFAGANVLPGSDFSLGCGRLVILHDFRSVLEAVDGNFGVFVSQGDCVGIELVSLCAQAARSWLQWCLSILCGTLWNRPAT